MAVRDDFAPGEVLAAADLNDTFASKADYPSGGSNGDLLTKSGTSTAWAAPSVAGLTLITAETFSAVSSVSVNGCFTSTHQNYRIVIWCSTSAGAEFRGRLRASGSDNTANLYQTGGTRVTTGGTVTGFGFSGNYFVLNSATGSAQASMSAFDIFRPQLANFTTIAGGGAGYAGGVSLYTGESFGGQYADGVVFDGFSIFPSSGNISGTIRIYGYRD